MITSLTSDFVDEKFTDWMLNVQEKYRYDIYIYIYLYTEV